ncbi:MAG: amino acid permease [Gemmataceae bacterium]
MQDKLTDGQGPKAALGLFDATSIIVGIVIGSGIYKTAPLIFSNVVQPWQALLVWGLGGVLSLIGALCYAELATAYPRSGGDYVYLTRAFGSWMGFLFGWAQLAVVLTASIGMMAYIFAEYGARLLGWSQYQEVHVLLAVAAVTVLTVFNTLGVVLGKWTQNILTLAKVLGLGGIVLVGFLWGRPEVLAEPVSVPAGATANLGLAMILVMYTYGGWNDAAFVAAEVRKQRRNIPLSLILGLLGITAIYLAVNAAYLAALGFEGARQAKEIAADVLALRLGEYAGKAMCVLVMISALGAINGMIFTGARVYSSLGSEHRLFAGLGTWHRRWQTPLWSLVVQWGLTVVLILGVGTAPGQSILDKFLMSIGLSPIPWDKYGGGFDTLLAASAPVFWSFFLLTGLAVFVLRERDSEVPRPFRVPLYPLLPLIFCGNCFFMLYSAVNYAGTLSVILGLVPVAVGLPLWWISQALQTTSRSVPGLAVSTDHIASAGQQLPTGRHV